jgi:glycerophosphoryl diester phosphodiesterase
MASGDRIRARGPGIFVGLALFVAASLGCRTTQPAPAAAPADAQTAPAFRPDALALRDHLLASNPEKPRMSAHRAGPGLDLPENALETLKARYQKHGPMIFEMDVRHSKDGALVIMHDATVDRTTNGKGEVDKLTLPQLKARAIWTGFWPPFGNPRASAMHS